MTTSATRLTDSIETAYAEGGGAAFAIRAGRGGSGRRSSTGSPNGSSAAAATSSTKCRSRGCSRSTTRSARARSATASATSSSWTWPGRAGSVEGLQQNAIEPWSKPHYRAQLAELKRMAKKRVRLDVPWAELTDDEKQFVIEGDGTTWEGVKGFFRWLERKKYKVHVRVFLSRYRGYLTCPECAGARLRREARDVRVGDRTIDVVCGLTVRDADAFFANLELSEKERRLPTRCCARSASGWDSCATSGWTTSRSIACRRRCRAGSRSASTSRRRWARRWSIRCTCSTSRRSASTHATTSG